MVERPSTMQVTSTLLTAWSSPSLRTLMSRSIGATAKNLPATTGPPDPPEMRRAPQTPANAARVRRLTAGQTYQRRPEPLRVGPLRAGATAGGLGKAMLPFISIRYLFRGGRSVYD